MGNWCAGNRMMKWESRETGRHNGELGELRNQGAEWPFERLQEWETSVGCREENYIYTTPFWALEKGQWEVRSCEPCFWGPKGNIASARQGLSCPPSPPGWYRHLLSKAGLAWWWSLHAPSNSKAAPSTA